MRTIKEIDSEHNGFITQTELDDILKMHYPEELEDKDLMPIIKRFASIQNKILIDYKRFRDCIMTQIHKNKQAKKAKNGSLLLKEESEKRHLSLEPNVIKVAEDYNLSTNKDGGLRNKNSNLSKFREAFEAKKAKSNERVGEGSGKKLFDKRDSKLVYV